MSGVYKIGYSAKKVDTLRKCIDLKNMKTCTCWDSEVTPKIVRQKDGIVCYKIGIFRNKYAYGGSLLSSNQVYTFEISASDENTNETVQSAISAIESQYEAQDAAETQQGQDEYSDDRNEKSYQTSQKRSKEEWWTSQAQNQASQDISKYTSENGTYGSGWSAAKANMRQQYGI